MATVQEIAAEMLRVFDGKPERWTKGVLARDAAGKMCNSTSPRAACWCFSGARQLACTRLGADPGEVANFHERAEQRAGYSVPVWNDYPRRTFADVQKLLTELAEEP